VCEEGEVSSAFLRTCVRRTYDILTILRNGRRCAPQHAVQVDITCPKGATISITSAFYGRSDSTTCVTAAQATGLGFDSNAWSTTTCTLNGAIDVAKSKCDGQGSCTISSSSKTWAKDPCVGIFKYSRLSYICNTPGALHAPSQSEQGRA
jgi:hypothetical protein